MIALLVLALGQTPDSARARTLTLLSEARFAAAEQSAASLPALRGEAQLGRGRWTEAEASFQRALAGGDADSLTAILGQARLAALRGQQVPARLGYLRLVSIYERQARRLSGKDLIAVAAALEALAQDRPQRFREALNVYDAAARRDPLSAEAPLRASELLLAKYNAEESRQGFEAVLERWPGQPRALLGIAMVRRLTGEADPVPPAESSLARHPGFVAGHVFLAQLALDTDDWAGAAARADSALALDPRSHSGWAVKGALAWLRGDSAAFAAADQAVRADDPAAAEPLVAAADAAARTRRYAEAVTLAQRAVARDSTSWRGWALLGANRLRVGDMVAGRAALQRAFTGDPFDLWTKNTLDLLDTLQRYPVSASARFRFVMDGKESALLSLYFAPLAEEAWDSLRRRYGVDPRAPVRVEVFPSHADFSVRTIGLAGIGALGVCFGPVIAMDSPSARDRGQFNWGSTLWHEIAHTFHMSLSGSRVPRWLTEGLAVVEERRARPGWGMSASPIFLLAVQAGTLPPLSRLNEAFLRPAGPHGIEFAYTMASYAAEYLETLGDSVSPRLLRAYGEGLDTRTVMGRVLGRPLDSLDAAFDTWLKARFAPRLAVLNDSSFARALQSGQAALRAGRRDEARVALSRAKTLFPEYAGADAPARALARLASERGDRAAAAAELEDVLATDESAYGAALELAGHYEALGRAAEAAGALERAMTVSPLDPALHERLATLAERLGRHDLIVRERRAVLATGPIDRAGAWYRLALALRAAGQQAEARRAVVRSLETAPGFADAQELLLDLVDARP